ncbi:MAG TPA: dNTP triphosphohydrolase [Catalimonadaceae bacterium]|nr:dNTP triphosphohydrolase [Catalimonadaceae bacterium]
MISWNTCFSGERFGIENSASIQRSEYERDWDRLIFSSPFRRLQGKTQVFPLPEEIFVHNRLTHSLEVASVGRSLGAIVGQGLAGLQTVLADAEALDFYQNHLKSVLASACLAHDLGNPAFGHSGEAAISKYFKDRELDAGFKNRFSASEWADLIAYEGNANALRILTRNFKGRSLDGFRLTYSTLSAILKYPCSSADSLGKKGPLGRKKYGFFQSDREAFLQVARKTGMVAEAGHEDLYRRHPFVYLVEAADDICYNIIDFEDAHRLGVLSASEVKNSFLSLLSTSSKTDRYKVEQTLKSMDGDENEEVAYLRAKCINFLTHRCAEIFLQHSQALLEGTFEGDLIGKIEEASEVLKSISKQSVEKIYNHSSVIKIELAGFRIMSGLIGDFVEAALCSAQSRNKMQEKVLDLVPLQYRFEESDSDYEKVMSILDFISGMTDQFALRLYRNLRGIEMPVR